MAGIILFIALAIGYALCGDTSGIEAIGKFVLFCIIFFTVAWVIVEIPWLIVLVVVVFLLWVFCSK